METVRERRRMYRRRRILLLLLLCGIAAAGTGLAVWLFGAGPEGEPPGEDPSQPAAVADPSESLPGVEDVSSPPDDKVVSEPDQSLPAQNTAPESGTDSTSAVPSSRPVPSSEPPVASSVPAAPSDNATGGDYIGFYYYEADKAERYVAYEQDNPGLSDDEVVWQVNTGLDGRVYEDYEAARYTETSHYIVNKYRKLPDSFEPANLVDIGGYKATAEAAEAYYKMQADAKAEGYSFWAISAYRSIDSQRNLYNRYLQQDPAEVVDTYSARPGFSEHHTGRAIDLCGSNHDFLQFARSPEGPWVHKNAYKYGFILRYPDGYESITGYAYESWHMTYVGVDIATDMHNKGIVTLEEYAVKFIDHTPL